MKLSEFDIHVEGRRVTCLLGEPDDGKLAPDPALVLTFTMDRRKSLTEPVYDVVTRAFVEAGHRALSFDLPHHGERVAPWKSGNLEGFAEAWAAGVDTFSMFVADGKAALDAALARGLAQPGRVFAAGVSRAGYCVLRLAAADARIAGVAALAPVTDWRLLREFRPIKDRADIAALALEHFAVSLAGRPVYLAIGSRDNRVGTECCIRLAQRISEEESRLAFERSALTLHVVADSEGHALANCWREAGGRFLLDLMNRAP